MAEEGDNCVYAIWRDNLIFCLIGTQNIAMKTSYIKVTTDNTQKNIKYSLFDNRDEMINNINECT